jgi:hypothetical protein
MEGGFREEAMWYEESMWLEEGKLAEEKVQHPVIMDLLLEGKRRRGGRWGGRDTIGKDGGEKEEGRRLQYEREGGGVVTAQSRPHSRQPVSHSCLS